MKLRNKTLVLVICILVLLNFSMFSTLAYLTDTSGVVNTFTVGTVDIDLNESDVDNDGNTKENKYKLIPGSELKKDPTVTVIKGSEEAYVRMILKVHGASAVDAVVKNSKHGLTSFTDLLLIKDGDEYKKMDNETWILEGVTRDTKENVDIYEFRYKTTVSGLDADGKDLTDDVDLPSLFEVMKLPGTLTIEELKDLEKGGFKMVVEAHAIQQMGFENDDAAWAAFKESEEAENAQKPGDDEGATNAQ